MADNYTVKCMGVDPVTGNVKTDVLRGSFEACGQVVKYYEKQTKHFVASFASGKDISDVYLCFEGDDVLALADYQHATRFIGQYRLDDAGVMPIDE